MNTMALYNSKSDTYYGSYERQDFILYQKNGTMAKTMIQNGFNPVAKHR